jgi:flagellar motor protein MotB
VTAPTSGPRRGGRAFMNHGLPLSAHPQRWLAPYADFTLVLMGCFLVMALVTPTGLPLPEGARSAPANKTAHEAPPHVWSERVAKQLAPMPGVESQAMPGGKLWVRLDGQTFFGSGVTTLTPQGRQAIARVAHVLTPMLRQDPTLRVRLVGYADPVPFRHPQWTNWELAALRAVVVGRELMERHRVAPWRISTLGMGDQAKGGAAVPPLAGGSLPVGVSSPSLEQGIFPQAPSPGHRRVDMLVWRAPVSRVLVTTEQMASVNVAGGGEQGASP